MNQPQTIRNGITHVIPVEPGYWLIDDKGEIVDKVIAWRVFTRDVALEDGMDVSHAYPVCVCTLRVVDFSVMTPDGEVLSEYYGFFRDVSSFLRAVQAEREQ